MLLRLCLRNRLFQLLPQCHVFSFLVRKSSLRAFVIAVQVQMVAAADRNAPETVFIISGFGMETVAVIYAGSGPALLPHLVKARQ